MEAHHGFLTSSERHTLRAVLHRASHSAQEHGRANAILLIDDGVPIPLIAKALFLDEQSVRNFLKRYRLGKIGALLENHYRGRKSKLTGEEKDRLRQHIAENLYMDCALVMTCISVPTYSWILKGTDKELPANSGRRRLNLNGAVDAESHEAIVINSPTIDADSTLELLVWIESV